MDKFNFKFIMITGILAVSVIIIGIALSNSQSTRQQSAQSSTSLDALVGKPFPNAQLYDKDGNSLTAANFKGKNTVLFFSEGIMCYPACWNEIAALGNNRSLNSQSTQVFSVVTDSPQQWATAKDKMPDLAKATILFDQWSNVSRQIGLLTLPSSMHMGQMPGHTYIVLDRQGIVRYVFDDPNMAENGNKIASVISKFN